MKMDIDFFKKNGFGFAIDRINGKDKAAHIYRLESDGEFGEPLCPLGWNRGKGGYSILRFNESKKGLCKKCQRMMEEEIKKR